MGSFFSPQKEKSYQSTSVSLPGWMSNDLQTLSSRAMGMVDNPYPTWTGPSYIGLTDAQQGAMGATADIAGYQPQQVTAGTLPQVDLSQYMNPYTQDVINAANADIDRATAQAQQQASGRAAQAGAFGGDRAAIEQAELAGQGIRTKANTSAQLYSQGYTQAQQAAQQDLARQLQASTTNAGLGLQGAQLGLGAAQQLFGQGEVGRQAQTTGLQFEQQQNLNQALWPMQQLQAASGIVTGSAPLFSTQNTMATTPGPSMFAQAAGLGAMAYGAAMRADGGRVGYARGGQVIEGEAEEVHEPDMSWMPAKVRSAVMALRPQRYEDGGEVDIAERLRGMRGFDDLGTGIGIAYDEPLDQTATGYLTGRERPDVPVGIAAVQPAAPRRAAAAPVAGMETPDQPLGIAGGYGMPQAAPDYGQDMPDNALGIAGGYRPMMEPEEGSGIGGWARRNVLPARDPEMGNFLINLGAGLAASRNRHVLGALGEGVLAAQQMRQRDDQARLIREERQQNRQDQNIRTKAEMEQRRELQQEANRIRQAEGEANRETRLEGLRLAAALRQGRSGGDDLTANQIASFRRSAMTEAAREAERLYEPGEERDAWVRRRAEDLFTEYTGGLAPSRQAAQPAPGAQADPGRAAEPPRRVPELPATALENLNKNLSALREIDNAIAQFTTSRGAGTGAWNAVVPEGLAQRINPAGIENRGNIASLSAVKIHDLTGAAQTVSEVNRLRPFLPSTSDSDEAILRKLVGLRRAYAAETQARVDSYGRYRIPDPVRGTLSAEPDVEDLRRQLRGRERPSEAPPLQRRQPAAPVTTPDGFVIEQVR